MKEAVTVSGRLNPAQMYLLGSALSIAAMTHFLRFPRNPVPIAPHSHSHPRPPFYPHHIFLNLTKIKKLVKGIKVLFDQSPMFIK